MGGEDRISDEQGDQLQSNANDEGETTNQTTVARAPVDGARTAMIFVCILLAILAALSLGCFVYQFGYRLANGDQYIGTPVRWPALLGHLIRGVGLALLSWRLAQYSRSIGPKTSELDAALSMRHQVFWKTFAFVFLLIIAYATFQTTYTSWVDRSERELLFPPEFTSGRVSFRKERIEIRRGFTEPMGRLERMQKFNSEERLFVAAEPEITGRDIASAVIEITEIFPGRQEVALLLKFTEEGTRKMQKLTTEHQNGPLAVLVDGKLRATPRVFATIPGDARLSGVITLEEAARIIENGRDQ